jgi:CubicO group peptidase (beta-lactamase class C family)
MRFLLLLLLLSISISTSSPLPLGRRHPLSDPDAPPQNCPVGPALVPLPSPLPGPLAAALSAINATAFSLLSPSTGPLGYALEITYGLSSAPLLSASSGLANASSSPPLPFLSSTPTRIASVTKVFMAVALFLLADRGLVDLDSPVAKTCPAFSVLPPPRPPPPPPPPHASITWRHLASHLSGLRRESEAFADPNATADALASVARTYLIAEPGERPSYSNLAFGVLGHLLAECVAPLDPTSSLPTTVPALIDALIVRPLNLLDTAVIAGQDVPPALAARMAQGYVSDGTGVPYPVPPAALDFGWVYPCGSALSSARDLATLGRALLAAASPSSPSSPFPGLSPASARALLTPSFRDADGSYLQGTPWEARPRGLNSTSLPASAALSLSGAAPFLVLNKGGNMPGYTALLALVPALNLTLSLVVNGGVDEFGQSDALFDLLLPTLAAALAPLDPFPYGNVGPRGTAPYAATYPTSIAGAVEVLPTGPDASALVWIWTVGGSPQISVLLDYAGTLSAGADPDPGAAEALALFAAQGLAGITSVDVFRAFIPAPGSLPKGSLPCLYDTTTAIRGQLVFFGLDVNGTARGTTIPGYAPGIAWVAV